MNKEFWAAVQFGLECRFNFDDAKNYSFEKMNDDFMLIVASQTKYTEDDVNFVLFPVLYRYGLTIHSYLTPEGKEALALLKSGKVPVFESKLSKPIDKAVVLKEILYNDKTAYPYDVMDDEHYLNDDVPGYLAMSVAIIELNGLSSKFEDWEIYMWEQICSILKKEPNACTDILSPLFTHNEDLKNFLDKHIGLGSEHFKVILDYTNQLCTYDVVCMFNY